MKVIYTTCTFNHLSRARSLAASVQEYCPQTRFIIGLIDDGNLDFEDKNIQKILRASDLQIPFLQEMFGKYSTLELNAALKPYFASYIFNSISDIQEIIYLDSDILLFHNLDPVYEALKESSIVLSPHALSTVKNGKSINDRNFLRSGVYNIGFYAVKRDEQGLDFLNWWMDKLRNECYIDSKKGLFAEQLWLNLVPVYFEQTHILRHPGCNVAYWNLHERWISHSDKGFMVNEKFPLIFYHFSGAGMDALEKDNLSEHQDRYTFQERPDVKPLFEKYIQNLKTFQFEKYNAYYSVSGGFKTKSAILKLLFEIYKKILKRIPFRD